MTADTMTSTPSESPGIQTAIFGGGCFWCLEAVFQRTTGVTRVLSGYMGGHLANPSYEAVCGKQTGHAEVVLVDYRPDQIGYAGLLDIFFTIHDPTTPNRQGNDVGPQYRSMVFATSASQCELASRKLGELKSSGVNAVTQLVDVSDEHWRVALDQNAPGGDSTTLRGVRPEAVFWPAESDHHSYFNRNPGQGYCLFVVAPKVIKAQQSFPAIVKD
ncbi:MAG: peptide-methionine (S)-S-oxide reductase MsrA [Burkholderiaceae bacterium]